MGEGMFAFPIFFCSLFCLLLATADAAYERSLFPHPPLDILPRLTTNPATLGDIEHPCGGIGHERPFGLAALSGHQLLLATPLPARFVIGFGAARRGPVRHREYAIWTGLGRRLFSRLSLGVAAQGLTWSGPAGRGAIALAVSSGWHIELPGSWSLAGMIRPAVGSVPGRAFLSLTRHDTTGAIAGDLSSRSGRPLMPTLSMTARIQRRLSLAGEVHSLAQSFGAGATLRQPPLIIHIHATTHPELGLSPSGSVGRTCW